MQFAERLGDELLRILRMTGNSYEPEDYGLREMLPRFVEFSTERRLNFAIRRGQQSRPGF
jgi:hypothetical protein